MPSIKKFTKSKKHNESQREKEALEAQKRARELAEEMAADKMEQEFYNKELAMYDQRQVGGGGAGGGAGGEFDEFGPGGGGGGGGVGATDYFISHDDAALGDVIVPAEEEEIGTNAVDVTEGDFENEKNSLGLPQDSEHQRGKDEKNGDEKLKKSSGKKMKFLRRSKNSKHKSKTNSSSQEQQLQQQEQEMLNTSIRSSSSNMNNNNNNNNDKNPPQYPPHDDSIEDLLGGFGDEEVQRSSMQMIQQQQKLDLPPPPSLPIGAAEEFTARRSARVASNKYTADGDTWVENLAVVELPFSKRSSKNEKHKKSLLRRSRNTSGASANAESDDEDDEGLPRQLAIRPYFQSLNTGMRVWDEPPSGASNVQYASGEVRKMAELQMADMRHNAEAVMEARNVAKMMEEERKANADRSSSGGRSSMISKKKLPKFGKKKKNSSSTTKMRKYKTAEDLGIAQSPQRAARRSAGNAAGNQIDYNEFDYYDEDMQMAIAMSIGNDGVISRYDEVSERGSITGATPGEDEALAMAISMSEKQQHEEKRKYQKEQEDLLMKMAIENSRADSNDNYVIKDDASSAAASEQGGELNNDTSTNKKGKKDKRRNRFRSSRTPKNADYGDDDNNAGGSGGGGKMPANNKQRTNTLDSSSDNPFDQYASDISSSSIEGTGGPMYPPGTSIDDLLGVGGAGSDAMEGVSMTPRSKYNQHANSNNGSGGGGGGVGASDGYLGVGYEDGAEERINSMASASSNNPALSSSRSIASASSMSTRSERLRKSFANSRTRTYSQDTNGSIASSVASVDLLDVEVPAGPVVGSVHTKPESDNSYSSSVGGGGGGGGVGVTGGGGAGGGGGIESGTDGEASVSSSLRKKFGEAIVSPRKKLSSKEKSGDNGEGDVTSVKSSMSKSSTKGRRKKKGEPSLEDSANLAGLV